MVCALVQVAGLLNNEELERYGQRAQHCSVGLAYSSPQQALMRKDREVKKSIYVDRLD